MAKTHYRYLYESDKHRAEWKQEWVTAALFVLGSDKALSYLYDDSVGIIITEAMQSPTIPLWLF